MVLASASSHGSRSKEPLTLHPTTLGSKAILNPKTFPYSFSTLHSSSFSGITFLDPKYKPQKGTTMEPMGRPTYSMNMLLGRLNCYPELPTPGLIWGP